MNCREVREVVFLVTDNEAGQEVVISFRRHLEICPECARRAQYMQRLVEMVRQRCCRVAAPPSLRVRILTSMRRDSLDWSDEEF
jgi:mycothiol system anti-sigma-R factor